MLQKNLNKNYFPQMNKTKETETSAAISKHFDRMYLFEQ